MKKLFLTLFVAGLSITSCTKSATCTCKNHAGTVQSQTSRKGNKSSVEDFKESCVKAKTVETFGATSYTTPCEVS